MIILLMASFITGATVMLLIARPVYQPIPVPVYRFTKRGDKSW
ncbi:MAG: hypothetical protein AB1801_03120 [Chloroflexota bacterium]